MFGKLKSGNSKNSRRAAGIASTNDTAPEVPANEQQQNRIILYFYNDQKISAVPDGDAKATAAQRDTVIKKLRAGEITWAEIEGFLRNVAMPLRDTKEDLNTVFEQIGQDLRQKQILAVLTGHNATDWQTVSRDDLKTLLGKPLKGQPNYRTPVGFAIFRQKFLSGIEDKADAEQMAEYNQAMDDLERKLYGRRFDYYQQIRLMKNGDPAKTEATNAQKPAEQSTSDNDNANQSTATLSNEEKINENITTKRPPVVLTGRAILDNEQSLAILNQAVFSGDPWRQDGSEYQLSANNLIGNNLLPAFSVKIDEQAVALTQPFQLSDGRGAALGFLPADGGYKVRGFYLEPRTGLWQFAPEVIRGARSEGMGQITEGYGSISTLLPIALQQNLTELVKVQGFREITTVNPDFLFAGTAKAYDTMQEHREAVARGQLKSDFYTEVDRNPVVINAQASDKSKTLPQLLSVNAELAPDFSQSAGKFMTYSALVGQVQVESFRSADGSATWAFCSDEYGRSWIGMIEINSPLTSTGCRKNWCAAGDFLTPLYEVSTQAGNYGDPNDLRRGMVGMWNRYLSNVSLIQAYINWRNQQRAE